jgi:hypothetical protein
VYQFSVLFLFVYANSISALEFFQGIVAAIRNSGGRFLDLDEYTQTYYEIGDRRACDKTSQALREGLAKIRSEIYSSLALDRQRSPRFQHERDSENRSLPWERYRDISVDFLKTIDRPVVLRGGQQEGDD